MTPYQTLVTGVQALTPNLALAAMDAALWTVPAVRLRAVQPLARAGAGRSSPNLKAVSRSTLRRAWNGPFVVDASAEALGQVHSLPPQGGHASFEAARQDELAPHVHIRSLPPQGGHASFEAARQEAS